jgi:hypothetical protein
VRVCVFERERECVHAFVCTIGVFVCRCKVHKSKGRTLFVVYVKPSKNKLDHSRNKIHMFTFTDCFLSNPAFQ